ncbi:MAG: lipopolysaccharide biosynthesis protein [Polymorphobacter sp.]
MTANPASADADLLARGGRTSFGGFLLRLGARMPFLFIAGQLYGAAALGLFAYATMVIELMAQLATLGLKRGLAAELAEGALPEPQIVADALLLAWIAAIIGALILVALPGLMFPNGGGGGLDRILPLMAVAIVTSDVAIAAMAFRHRLGVAVVARSVVEPWTLAIVALLMAFTPLKRDGLLIAYAASMVAAMTASIVPLWREFGWPSGWVPHWRRLVELARANLPLAGADAAEWGSRRLDIFILGRFASAEVVGIYFIAQQIATLPGKLKSSFDSILAPVVTRSLATGDTAGVAAHIRQVGFWVGAAQLGSGLALGFTANASLGLFGSGFAVGAGVLALLLLVEFFGAQATVSETALIYLRRKSNLLLSLLGLLLQTGLTLWLVPLFGGVGAAAGLATAALFLAVTKTLMLERVLAAPVMGWRWTLAVAAVPAVGAGLLVQQLSGLVQLAVGVPLVLGVFAAVIWTIGFRGPDRLLFVRRSV